MKFVFLKLERFYKTKKKKNGILATVQLHWFMLVEMQQTEPDYVDGQCKTHHAAEINI